MIEHNEPGLIANLGIKELLDALPFYVLLVDEKHHILLANKAVTSQFGLELADIVGGYCPRIIHGSDEPIPHCPLEDAVKSGHPMEREYFDPKYNKWFASAIYPSGCKAADGRTIYIHMTHDITLRKQAEEKLKLNIDKMQRIINAGIQALTTIVEKRDPYTAGHQFHVSKLAHSIAVEMGLPREQAEGIRVSGLVHDIGKIAVPIEILSKPGKISEHELNIIRTHPQVGYNILKEIEFPWPVAQIVLEHHERLDGSGYPQGLAGDSIMLEARIISVADVVEAMSSHRPYRPTLGIDKALEEISLNKGILYDPLVVDTCIKLFTKQGFTFD
jgi:putative nucleotidyltransferase with HDIG domain/PAS domain S-box-containing protein